jgi:hypothetical protein
MLINASVFIGTVESYRLLWLTGRYSGGKTSFAYRLAREFLEKGYRLVSNNRNVWSDNFQDVKICDDGMLHCVYIIDEGGEYFEENRQIKTMCRNAAKMDCIYLIPSFFPPARAAQVIICQPMFHFKQIGLPLYVYRWKVRHGAFSDMGIFFWLYPQEVYGIYSRQDPGGGSEELVNFAIERCEDFAKFYGRTTKRNAVQEVEDGGFSVFGDAVQAFSSDLEQFETVLNRKSKKRRF